MECFATIYFYRSIPVAECDEQEKAAAVIASDERKSRDMVFLWSFVGSILCSII